MTTHSFLPPSGAAAWSRCALWPTMNARFPQADSPETLEGTAAHWVAGEAWAGRFHPEGATTPNGVIVTGEMLDGAEMVVETLRTQIEPFLVVHVEEQVKIPAIHEECFGTPDFWAFNPIPMVLDVIDYKFGHGFVDEFFNPQGILYMLGILERYRPKLPQDIGALRVRFTIVQPRCFYRGAPVRTHEYTLSQVYGRVKGLRAAAEAAFAAEPVATTNSECGYCPGRHACSALQLAAYQDAETSSSRQPHDLTPQAAALELRMLERALDRLTSRVDGLRELTLTNMRNGASVPHYRLENGRGRVQWKAPVEQIVSLGTLFGKNLSKPGVITPAQARKLGIDEAVITAYSEAIPGNQKLVPQNNADAARVFGLESK